MRASDDGKTLYGTAVVYNQTSELLYGYFTEEIAPGAFDESLRSDSSIDIYCDVDHDINRILGRVSAGTLKLDPRDDGIGVECSVGDYSYARDLVEAIRRKDLQGMSFIFDVQDADNETRDGRPHRIVKKAKLFEVAFVHFPAYPQTDAGVRMAFPVEGERRAIEAFSWVEDIERYRRRLLLAEMS